MTVPDSHQPDRMFGCTVMWGPPVRFINDMGLHVCNLPDKHEAGRHRCKCGATTTDSVVREAAP